MCAPRKCKNCQAAPPACQLKNGLCPSCYSISLQVKK